MRRQRWRRPRPACRRWRSSTSACRRWTATTSPGRSARSRHGPSWLIALTGYGGQSGESAANAAGFDALLVKPVSVDVLLGHIAALLASGAVQGRAAASTRPWNNIAVRIATAAVPPFFKNGFLVSCEETAEAVLIDPGDEVETIIRDAASSGVDVTGDPADARPSRPHHRRRRARRPRSACRSGCTTTICSCTTPPSSKGLMFGLRVETTAARRRVLRPPAARSRSATTSSSRSTRRVIVPAASVWPSAALTGRRASCSSATRSLPDRSGERICPAAHQQTLLRSIREVLFRFPDETVVHPGHGPETTIGRERRTNPFLAGR